MRQKGRGFEYMCYHKSSMEKRKKKKIIFFFVVIYADTKSVSTQQLKVDHKDWKHGSIRGTEI